jgi:hypothetical protein
LDLNVSFDGRATGAVQPDLAWLSPVIACFAEEGPFAPLMSPKFFILEGMGCRLRKAGLCDTLSF